jgi:NAD(P)-dependent dehydrogenase (short-subunit alcohol dehydrogenase family)
MSLYRAQPGDGVAWVTGASTGIGRSLARDLVAEGYTVAVTARDEERLATLVDEIAGMPGRILLFPCDVTDEDGMLKTVAAIEDKAGPIVLAIFNAGAFFPTRGERMDVQNFARTYELNILGTLYGLVPVVARMQSRGRGQIALMGSVTAYFGLPSAAAYGSSKAALNNLAESLKFDFDKMNIRLQIINPGFVETPLTEKKPFPMPGIMSADKASARIARGLRTGGFEVAFPRRFTLFLKLLKLFPHAVYFWFMNWATGWRKRPLGPMRKPRKD